MKVLCGALALALLSGIGAGSLSAEAVSSTAAAMDKQAWKDQLGSIEAQMTAIRAEIQQLNAQKTVLWDQVGALRHQKHLAELQHRLDDLGHKIAEAQAKSNTAKVSELSARQGILQKELALQQDIAALQVKLQAAHAGADTPTAKTLSGQVQADRDSVKALYPPKPGTTPAPSSAVTATPKPVTTPKPEDPEIQSLLDKIHALEEQIKQDQAKLEGLKQQALALKGQLKAAGK